MRIFSTKEVKGLPLGTRVDVESEIAPYAVIRCIVAKEKNTKKLRSIDTDETIRIQTYVTYHYKFPEEKETA